MRVKLSREFSSQEIIDAFKQAGSFIESADVKWESHEFVDKIQYEPTSSLQTVRSAGVTVSRLVLEKKWVFWGKEVWKKSNSYKFTLEPIDLSYQRKEINVEISCSRFCSEYGGIAHFTVEPEDSGFEAIRPSFEKMISFFYALLIKNAQ